MGAITMEDLLLFNRNKLFQGDHIRLLEFPQHSLMHILLEKPTYLLQFVSDLTFQAEILHFPHLLLAFKGHQNTFELS